MKVAKHIRSRKATHGKCRVSAQRAAIAEREGRRTRGLPTAAAVVVLAQQTARATASLLEAFEMEASLQIPGGVLAAGVPAGRSLSTN